MAETTLYIQHQQRLSVEQIEGLAVDGATVSARDDGQIVVQWPDVRLSITTVPRGKELIGHLNGFRGFVINANGGLEDENIAGLLETISSVETLLDCHVEPEFDRENKVKSLIVSMACTLEAFMFAEGNIYTPFGKRLFGTGHAIPYADLSELTVRKTDFEEVKTTPQQQQRTKRIQKLLLPRDVPSFQHPIRWMPDDEAVQLRTPSEVARRVIALHAVVCLARGRPRGEVLDELKRADVMDALSPSEAALLKSPSIQEQARMPMIWRLEALWLLMWALRYVDKFTWPSHLVDVEALHDMIFKASQEDPGKFIAQAKLRSKKTLLDTTELVTRIHWAIRQAMIEGEPIPENLDWSKPSQMVAVAGCPSVGVVAERHHALNWLIRFDNADWDDVDTPT